MMRPAVRREMAAYCRYGARRPWLPAVARLAASLSARLRQGAALERVPLTYLHRSSGEGRPALRGLPPVKLRLGREAVPPQTLDLPLAGRTYRTTRNVDWGATFDDREDRFALHRFGWCLRLLVEQPTAGTAAALWDMVCGWLAEKPSLSDGAAWHPYTVSERIVHWLILLAVVESNGVPHEDRETVLASVAEQADHLSRHLESYGSRHTNNHLTNNGRALYFAGLAVGDPVLQHAGREILIREPARMFTDSGFLREGSSHYHLLLCRSYLEALWTAEAVGDAPLSRATQDLVARMVARAGFFNAGDGGPLPLIGDVSPDCRPDWLAPLAGIGKGGWLELWGRDIPPATTPGGFSGFSDGGWFRYLGGRYTLFFHAGTRFTVPPASHAHHDIGGFEFRSCGRPLIADPGRPSYRDEGPGETFLGASAHAAVTVDGHEPFVSLGINGARFMLDEYFRHSVETSWEPEQGRFTVAHDGFSRLGRLGWWRRTLRFSENGVALSDELEGRGRHTVEATFPLHPDVSAVLREGDLVMDAGGACRWVLDWEPGGADVDVTPRPFSPAYGQTAASRCVSVRWRTDLPCRMRFRLRAED